MIVKNSYGKPYLADKNEITGEISKVLKCYHNDNTITYDRFDYSDNGEWEEATEEDLKLSGNTYYLEDGSMPYGTR